MTEMDVKEALERVGGRFQPPRDGFDRTRRRRDHRRLRRRVSATLVAAAVAVGGGLVAWRAFSGTAAAPVRHPRPAGSAPTSVPAPGPSDTFSPPNCPPHQGEYSLVFGPEVGRPGTEVIVGGPIPLYDKSGRYAPTDRVWVWWNLDPDRYVSGIPGQSPIPGVAGQPILLGEVDVEGLCSWDLRFRIPQVGPGTYPVVAIYSSPDEGGGRGYASYRSIPLEVAG